jgi:hypothetical protein
VTARPTVGNSARTCASTAALGSISTASPFTSATLTSAGASVVAPSSGSTSTDDALPLTLAGQRMSAPGCPR